MSVTVDLDEATLAALRAEAERRGVSIDVVIAESVREHLDASPVNTPHEGGHRFGFVGIAASGDGRLSQDYKAIRREAFANKKSDEV